MLFQKHIFKKILSFCDDRLEVSQKRKYNKVKLEFLDLVEMYWQDYLNLNFWISYSYLDPPNFSDTFIVWNKCYYNNQLLPNFYPPILFD